MAYKYTLAMDLDTMIDALNWMEIDDQIAYLKMLDYDYKELPAGDRQEIIDALATIETKKQHKELTALLGPF